MVKEYKPVSVLYFDGTHLICENIEELHWMAKMIGLKPKYFQNREGGIAHYDVWGKPKDKLLSWGNVKVVTSKKLIELVRRKQVEF